MDDFKHISVSHVRVVVKPDSSFADAIREAMLIAVKEWRNVVFRFGEREYNIQVNDLIASIDLNKG